MKRLNLLGFLQCHDAFGDIKCSFGVYAHNLSDNEMFVKRLNQYNTTHTDRSTNSKSGFNEWFEQKLFYYYYCRLQTTTRQGRGRDQHFK